MPYSIPWQVALFLDLPDGRFVQNCGGTILSPRHVMTAAHCLTIHTQIHRIVVGLHSKNETEITKKGAVVHEMCRYVSAGFDMAIVHLKKPIEFGPRAVPACLPTSKMAGDFLANKTMTTSGWGAVLDSRDEPTPNNLRFVKVRGVTNELCNEMYAAVGDIVRPDELCAGDVVEGGIDACYGDSGGKIILDYVNVPRVSNII